MVVRTRERRTYKGLITDNTVWDSFRLRDDDVIVNTPPKCGTTWTLNILMMLIHGKVVPDAGHSNHAPWLDCGLRDQEAMAAFLDGLDRRRVIKSHTPMDGVPYLPGPRYFFVYRHPVDMHFSFRDHIENMKSDILDFVMPGGDVEGFNRFISAPAADCGTDDLSVASLVHHYRTALALRNQPNVHFLHYADLSRDLAGQIRRMADILGKSFGDTEIEAFAEANTFASMRKTVAQSERRFAEDGAFRDAARFFASGTSNKWEGRLSPADISRYRASIGALLSADDIAWLEWGDRRAP